MRSSFWFYTKVTSFNLINFSLGGTAEYENYITGNNIIATDTKKAMKEVLTDIQNGTFAKNFTTDYDTKFEFLKFSRKTKCDHEIERVGKEIRKLIVMK